MFMKLFTTYKTLRWLYDAYQRWRLAKRVHRELKARGLSPLGAILKGLR